MSPIVWQVGFLDPEDPDVNFDNLGEWEPFGIQANGIIATRRQVHTEDGEDRSSVRPHHGPGDPQ